MDNVRPSIQRNHVQSILWSALAYLCNESAHIATRNAVHSQLLGIKPDYTEMFSNALKFHLLGDTGENLFKVLDAIEANEIYKIPEQCVDVYTKIIELYPFMKDKLEKGKHEEIKLKIYKETRQGGEKALYLYKQLISLRQNEDGFCACNLCCEVRDSKDIWSSTSPDNGYARVMALHIDNLNQFACVLPGYQKTES